MKKIIKISIALIVILIISLTYYSSIIKKEVTPIIKEEINKNINAKVTFGDFNISFFSSFPDITFSINDININGENQFEGTKLTSIGKLDVVIDLMPLISNSEVNIKHFSINNTYLNIKTLTDGSSNYDIALSEEVTTTQTVNNNKENNFQLKLQSYSFNNVTIIYDDRVSDMYLEIENLNHLGSGDFNQDIFKLDAETKIEKLRLNYEGINYCKNIKTVLNTTLNMNMSTMKFTFEKSTATFNGLNLDMDGWLSMPNNTDIEMDLNINAIDNNFKSLLSLIPSVYTNDFETIETKGNFSFNSNFKGVYNDNNLPSYKLSLLINNGYFNYPELPKSVDNINIKLDIASSNGVIENTKINLSKFHMELGGNPIDFNIKLHNPLSNPYFKGGALGKINFETISDIIPLEEGTNLSGSLIANANFEGDIAALEAEEYHKFKAEGSFEVNQLKYKGRDLNYPIFIKSAKLEFSPKEIKLSNTKLDLGDSDIQLSGIVRNYFPYYFNNKTLKGNLDLKSQFINVNQLIGPDIAESSANTEVNDSSELSLVAIPKNLNLSFSSTIEKLNYDNIELEQVNGKIIVKNEKLVLDKLQANLMQGHMNMNGEYQIKKPQAQFSFSINHFDIKESFSTIDAIKKFIPIAENSSGKFSMSMSMSTNLFNNMDIDYSSFNAQGTLNTESVIIENSGLMKKVADVLKDEKYSKIDLEDTEIKFTIENGTITTKPFDANIGNKKATISGSSNLNTELDYLISTAIDPSGFIKTGSSINNLLGSFELSKMVNLELVIKGLMSKPTITPRLSSEGNSGAKDITTAVKETIKDKSKELINNKRKELIKAATEQGNKLIEEAQKQANLLNENAKKNGEALKKEADKQGAALIKQAGNNFIKKKAAELAVTKLNNETNKKIDNLVAAANKKGESLVNIAKNKKSQLIKKAEKN